MATRAEGRMNLAALQQRDPYITDIVDTASQVALYSFNSVTNEWEKTDVEGTLFVYTRSASPINGFMIMNRLGLHDLIEPINKNLEFQLQDPFLLYRNGKAIYGIWFYDKDECARIGQLMNSLVQIALENQEEKDVNQSRQRRASESDTMSDRAEKLPRPPAKNVDIIQMLSKAQDEYDKQAKGGPSTPRVEPKPMTDNPNAAATKTGSTLIKPLALKASTSQSDTDMESGAAGAVGGVGVGADAGATTPNTQISLDALFRRATLQQGVSAPPEGSTGPKPYHRSQSMMEPSVPASTPAPPSGLPALIQRMMSNSGTTVEELERQHRGDIPRDQMPQPAGAEAPAAPAPSRSIVNGAPAQHSQQAQQNNATFWQSFGAQGESQSPDTALKRTLNILPPRLPAASVGLMGPSTSVSRPAGSQSTFSSSNAQPVGMARTVSAHEDMSAHAATTPTSNIDTTGLAQRMAAMVTTPVSSSQMRPANICGPPLPAAPTLVGHTTLPASQRHVSGGGAVTNNMGSPMTSGDLSLTTQTPGAKSGVLLTPMAFEFSSPRVTPTQTVLPPPSVFQSSGSGEGGRLSQTSPLLAGAVGGIASTLGLGAETPDITPLTREQLQQALLYLLKNDQDFLRVLHEAYVKSLTSSLFTQHKS